MSAEAPPVVETAEERAAGEAGAPAASTSRRTALPSTPLVASALAIGTLVLYAPVASHGFIRFDDNRYLTDNPVVQQGLSWAGAAWAFTTLHASNWHPLTWLSHMLDVQLFGMSPGAHHVVNAVLHAANTALLFVVLVRMTGARWRSAFVAALFAVHPLHVESVAWIAERKDVLSTSFGLLALHAYSRYAARPRPRAYVLVLVWFVASLLAKPMWVTLPFLLLLLDFWPSRRIAALPAGADAEPPRFPAQPWSRLLVEKAPLLAVAALSSAVTVIAQDRGGALAGLELPLSARLANASVSCVQYVAKTLWPSPLAVFYPYQAVGVATSIASGAAVAGVTALLLARASRAPWAAVGWCWFLGTLVPVIGIVQVGGQALADRYTYLPAIGLFVAIAWGAHRLAGTWRRGVPLAAAGIAVVAALSIVASRQLARWATHESLFRHALAVTKDNALAHGALADDLRVQGRLPEALFHAREATRLDPGSARHWSNLGVSYRDAGLLPEAKEAVERSLALNPRYALAWRVLGLVEQDLGDLPAAIASFERATQLAPGDSNAWFSLGAAHGKALRVLEAIRAYEETVRLAPNHFGAWTNVAALYQFAGRNAEAGAAFEAAARAEPTNPVGWRNLGVFLVKTGRLADGAGALRESLRRDPGNVNVLRRLGFVLADLNAKDEAFGIAARLDAIDPVAASDIRRRVGERR